jgi:hypothetical protein
MCRRANEKSPVADKNTGRNVRDDLRFAVGFAAHLSALAH